VGESNYEGLATVVSKCQSVEKIKISQSRK